MGDERGGAGRVDGGPRTTQDERARVRACVVLIDATATG